VTLAADPYETAVFKATKYRRRPRMDAFLGAFKEDKETVILLPGGAASELWRAREKVDDVDPSQYTFDQVWLKVGITFGDGKTLKISQNGRDLGEQVIVAGDDIQFCLGRIRPYVKAMSFFQGMAGFNALLLGWDWRRNVLTAVDILNDVIDEIVRHVPADKKQKVLKNIFIVGHSMGGMVAKLFFKRYEPRAREIGGMVSVGTPCYGYLGQLRRIYEGESEINQYYTAKTVAKIYSSFTGLYSLFPIDRETYERDGTALGLMSYPVTEINGTTPADPYQKNSSPPYPKWFWYKELPKTLSVRRDLASPLPNDLSKAVFHIRTVKANPPTPVAANWDQKLPDDYDPDKSPSPIKIHLGRGDETIPHWSARLASTPDGNVHDFDKGEHMTLMAQDFILRKILEIVGARTVTETEFIKEYGPNPEIATTEEAAKFMTKFRAETPMNLDYIPERYAWRILQNSLM
jgi:pimeloyl-ACP methyl ester carboxylesterase